MKNVKLIKTFALFAGLLLLATGGWGQLFFQDFKSSSIVSNYVSATPSNGQFNAISTSGAGTVVSITNDQLQFSRTANAGSFSRTTDFFPVPSTLIYQIDITISGNTAAQTTAAVFQAGSGFGTANSTELNANTYARFAVNFTATDGEFQIRDITNLTNSILLSGKQRITWVMNNSGSTVDYLAPNGNTISLENDKVDLWAGTTILFNGVNIQTTDRVITDLKFAFTAGTGTIAIDEILIDPIPSSTPTITVTPTTLSGFTCEEGSGPSDEQTLTISGSNLTEDISIAAPTNYEISLNSGSGYTSPITLTESDGTVSATTIYVRLKAGLSAGSYNDENITASSGDADDKTVTCNGSVTGAPTTYSWIGADNASWALGANWSPERTTPETTDILQFNDGTTKTVTFVPTQTIGRLLVTGSTNITLQTDAASTLTIRGGHGTNLEVGAGSKLNVSGSSALQICLATGATGSISGSMTFSGGAHRLLTVDASGIMIISGAVFTTGSGFSGNAFGTAALNSIIFSNGSTYLHEAGSHPFGANEPNSVVVFQSGSLFRNRSGTPAFSGRTYADFENDNSGTASPSGGSAVSIDNLKITQGTFNFNMNDMPGHSIKGNIEVLAGATLNFAPTSAGIVNLNGTSLQTISGGGTISAGANSTLIANNTSGVVLDATATFNNFTISDGSLTVNSSEYLTVNGTLTNTPGTSGLVIKSGGSLIHSNAGVAATVEREIAAATWGDGQDGWHLIGSPVAGQAITGAWTPSGAGDDYDFYAWSEPTSSWLNQKKAENSITQFNLGQGYLAAYQQTGTRQFAGTLNAADVPVDLTRSASGAYLGFNLLGNPFANALTWGTGWTLGNVGAIAYVWNEATKSYVKRNAGDPIPAANGFMVYLGSGTGQSLTIPAAARTHSGQAWCKSNNERIVLVARDPAGQSAQRSHVGFNPDATEGFDLAYDGMFLSGFAPRFYSVIPDGKLMVNTLQELTDDLVIRFGFEKNKATDFSIELAEEITGTSLYLLDRKLGTQHHLTFDEPYHFSSAEGDNPMRFELRFSPADFTTINEQLPELVRLYTAAKVLHIDLAQGSHGRTLEIFDLTGRRLTGQTLPEGSRHTHSFELPTGIYLVRVTMNEGVHTQRVIVK